LRNQRGRGRKGNSTGILSSTRQGFGDGKEKLTYIFRRKKWVEKLGKSNERKRERGLRICPCPFKMMLVREVVRT
jgi:hypothetical protein